MVSATSANLQKSLGTFGTFRSFLLFDERKDQKAERAHWPHWPPQPFLTLLPHYMIFFLNIIIMH